MQISSTSAGLYPAPLPAVRKPATPVAQQLVPAATRVAKDAHEAVLAAQPGAGDVKKELSSVAIASLLERQNIGGSNNSFNGSTRQQAVAAYTDVATQEHREELVALLGIDVFA